MKNLTRHLTPLALLLLLILTACSSGGRQFKIKGKFLHLNQGEFYIYNPEGGLRGLDTIKVQSGRFAIDLPCDYPQTLLLLFPNFSQQPIFAEPGKSVRIKGDASRLKQLRVNGTKENERMNDFRELTADLSPDETIRQAEKFILDNPQSVVSVYLVTQYFMQGTHINYPKALQLINTLLQKQPGNSTLLQLRQTATRLAATAQGRPLPNLTVRDINGQVVHLSQLAAQSPLLLITLWASWSYDSMNMQRQMKDLQRRSHGRLQIVSVSVDPDPRLCRQFSERDSIKWPNICDGNMFQQPIVQQLGLSTVPDNLLLQNGKVIARNLPIPKLKKKLQEELKIP